MRDFAQNCLLGYIIFLVPSITYSQDATTDIDAKYVKRRVSAQGCVAKLSLNIYTPYLIQNRHFGARFGRYLEIIGRKPASYRC